MGGWSHGVVKTPREVARDIEVGKAGLDLTTDGGTTMGESGVDLTLVQAINRLTLFFTPAIFEAEACATPKVMWCTLFLRLYLNVSTSHGDGLARFGITKG